MKLGAWHAASTLALVLTSSCLRPPSPAEQVTEAAREFNLAARFGRLDIAGEQTTEAARQSFFERRRQWGNELRVVDAELSGMTMPSKDRAEVLVNVAWMRMSEGLLRTTVVSQSWTAEERGWRLSRERRVAGDVGLFGEQVVVLTPPVREDVHFPSKTIR